MLSCDVGRIDAQMPCNGRSAPAGRESTPRSVQPLEDKVAEIGLQELPQVVTELHVEVTVEHRAGGAAAADRDYRRRNVPAKESQTLNIWSLTLI